MTVSVTTLTVPNMHVTFAVVLLCLSILYAAPVAYAGANDDDLTTPNSQEVTPSKYAKEGYDEIDIDLQ